MLCFRCWQLGWGGWRTSVLRPPPRPPPEAAKESICRQSREGGGCRSSAAVPRSHRHLAISGLSSIILAALGALNLQFWGVSSIQSLSRVWLFGTPWTAARRASLSITNSWSPPKPHVRRVGDAIQPSYPLLSPSPALNLSFPFLCNQFSELRQLKSWVQSGHRVNFSIWTFSIYKTAYKIWLRMLSITREKDSPVARTVKTVPAVQETRVQPLGWEDPLEKELAPHSSILAWKIPWMEEPGRLQSMRSQRDVTEWSHFTWEGTKGPDSAQQLHCCYVVSFDRFPLFQHFLLLWLNLLLTKVLHRQEAGRGHGGGRGSYGPAPFQRVSTRASVCAAPRVTRQQSMEWSLELQLMCVVLCGWSLLLLAYLMLFLTTFVSQGSNCSSLCTLFIYSWYSFHLSFKKCSCLGKMLIRVTDCLFPSMCQQKAPTLSRFLLMWLPAPVHTMVFKSSS